MNDGTQFDPSNLSPLFGNIFSLLFFATLIFFIVYTFVITYHWVRWGNIHMTTLTLGTYFAGSLLCLILLSAAYLAL